MRLEPFGTGQIFAHEQTMSGPKADRLKLYHATGLQPVARCSASTPTPRARCSRSSSRSRGRARRSIATDHLGVINRLWVVTDTQAISAVIGLMGPKPVFIADGHHRYETGLKYLDEQAGRWRVPDDDPANFTLMMLVGMSDPGLIILPTHRLVSGLAGRHHGRSWRRC